MQHKMWKLSLFSIGITPDNDNCSDYHPGANLLFQLVLIWRSKTTDFMYIMIHVILKHWRLKAKMDVALKKIVSPLVLEKATT